MTDHPVTEHPTSGPDRWGLPDGERGGATVWALSVIALLAAAMGLALVLAAAVVARHRAATAADLAALAGAEELLAGPAAACARAAEIARLHSADLEACELRGTSLAVEVSLTEAPPGWAGAQLLAPARGRARAGPAP